MNALRQKLHSGRGASMALALLFFLVCAMVGSVVVMSASANTDRTALRRQEQQAYLAVTSAYEFLYADLQAAMTAGSLSFVGSESHVFLECYTLKPGETLVEVIDNGVSRGTDLTSCGQGGETSAFDTVTAPDCYIGPLLAEMAETIAKTVTTYNTPTLAQDSLTRAFTIDSPGLPQVTVSLTMSGVAATRYNVDILLTVADSAYSLLFKLVGSSAAPALTSAAVSPPLSNHSHVVSYPGILPDNSWGIITVTYVSGERRNTLTTTVNWLFDIHPVNKGGV